MGGAWAPACVVLGAMLEPMCYPSSCLSCCSSLFRSLLLLLLLLLLLAWLSWLPRLPHRASAWLIRPAGLAHLGTDDCPCACPPRAPWGVRVPLQSGSAPLSPTTA
ncbi:unnamed protein product [Prorocentrum cordatum]|uniref:Uncharacterized protein n=1 Tax=Prorocentrum cordatum TaxID=2364126 RepID=A0ABN9UNI3_9DINO|nr:unnamed protein product [Polarella glacialis]